MQMMGGGDMGLVFPSWIQAGFITVETTGDTLVIQHEFGRKPSDAYLINMSADLDTDRTCIMANSAVGNLKDRSDTANPYGVRSGLLRNYGLGNVGISGWSSSSNLTEMDENSVTFGKLNSYSRNYVAGEQYFYIIFDRKIPGDQ